MGKPKSHSSKAKKLAKKKDIASSSPSYSIDELLEKASGLLDECQFELAEKFCQRALEMSSDHPQALEMSANLLLEQGEVEKAQHCLGRAITVQPESGHTKYMTAAQLFSGVESRDLYCKGVQLLVAGTAAADSETAAQLSTAYVALCELYMSDLCDAPEAETETARFISLAIEADGTNSEAWQAEASYKLILGDVEGAKTSISRSLELWLPQHTAFLEKGEGMETSLSYNSRLATVKVLLDLEMFDEATQICDALVEEDDEVVAPWYLLGWLNYLREDQDYWGNVRHYLARAQQVQVMNPTDDDEMVQHIGEILAEVGVEDTQPEPPVDLDLNEGDHEKAELIANILDKEKEESDSEDKMES
eukprot:TRINITY_DN3519_c0_g1_i1.p1 TRINITY_DN3519_c0_g1~~TRINITY_DN3519_c0_g1_i1.p1  ORF type:complete len:379 (+),score=147.35 TRINITY_DN3519_c0_g1_i1:51-1139(+)